MTLDIILEEIKKANSIVILTHESPDGDAIGSSLAMEKALRDIGKNPDVIIKEYPRIFDFLPNANVVKGLSISGSSAENSQDEVEEWINNLGF